MESPLVSVAMCTYNGAKYLPKQLDSIISQTYKNMEVVIVDDCSADGTFEILSQYAQQYPHIKCYRNKTNLGFNKNFEEAVKHTSGDYIAISDQDDIWLPGKIESLLNAISDNWLVFSNSVYINDDDELLHNHLLTGFKFYGLDFKSILLKNFVTGHTSLFKRELLTRVLPFPKKGFYDWWMGFIAIYHHKLVYLDEVLTQYRIHTRSVVQEIRKNEKKTLTRIELDYLRTMLQNFIAYDELKPADKAFIEKLLNTLDNPGYKNIRLTKLLYNHYSALFPDHKFRRGLSKLNFAAGYAKYYAS